MLHVSIRDPIGGPPTTEDDKAKIAFQHEVRSAIVSPDLQGIPNRLESRCNREPISYAVVRESTELLHNSRHPWCSGIDGCFQNTPGHATLHNPREETQEKLYVSFREPDDEPFDILQVEQTIAPQTSSRYDDRHLSTYNVSLLDNVLDDALPSTASAASRSSTASINTEVEPFPCPRDPLDRDQIEKGQRLSAIGDGEIGMADIIAESTSARMTDALATPSHNYHALSPLAGENVPSYLPTFTTQPSLVSTSEDDSTSAESSSVLNESDLSIEDQKAIPTKVDQANTTDLSKIPENPARTPSEESRISHQRNVSENPPVREESVEALECQDSEPKLVASSFADEETDTMQSLDDALWLQSIEAADRKDPSTQTVLDNTVENTFKPTSQYGGSLQGYARSGKKKHWWRQKYSMDDDDLTLGGVTKHTSNRSRSRLKVDSEGEECVEAVENHGSGTLLFFENSNSSTQLKEDQATFVAAFTAPSVVRSRGHNEQINAQSKLFADTIILDRVVPTDYALQQPVPTDIEMQLESKQRKKAFRRSVFGIFSCKRPPCPTL